MRSVSAAILVLAMSTMVGAQSSLEQSREATPRPTIGLPLPPIGLPLPPIGLTSSGTGLSSPGPDRRVAPVEHQSSRGRAPKRSSTAIIYFVPGFDAGPGVTSRVPSAPAPPPEPAQRLGRVRLDVTSGTTPQIYPPLIYVDGYYVGTLDELNGEVAVDAGPHTFDVRADGFETLTLKVQVPSDRVITYRGALKPVGAEVAPAPQALGTPVAPAHTTIYVIPGCYVGNVPPQDAHLPVGCDERLAVAFAAEP